MKISARLTGVTHRPDQRKVTLCRWLTLEDGADLPAAIRAALLKRRDCGSPFIGDSVTLEFPAGKRFTYVVETSPIATGGLTLELQA